MLGYVFILVVFMVIIISDIWIQSSADIGQMRTLKTNQVCILENSVQLARSNFMFGNRENDGSVH